MKKFSSVRPISGENAPWFRPELDQNSPLKSLIVILSPSCYLRDKRQLAPPGVPLQWWCHHHSFNFLNLSHTLSPLSPPLVIFAPAIIQSEIYSIAKQKVRSRMFLLLLNFFKYLLPEKLWILIFLFLWSSWSYTSLQKRHFRKAICISQICK